MIKVLNLYAGIGGNRKLWKNVKVTAVENNPEIARVYKEFFPEDVVVVGDAHQYILDHYDEFDFIWSSPPCPTHSRMRNLINNCEECIKKFPDMKLYEEILFLKHFFKGKWVIENVIPYYETLINPNCFIQRHCFWSNFDIQTINIPKDNVAKSTKEKLSKEKGIVLPEYSINKRLLLRNAVNPIIGLHIFKMAFKEPQQTLTKLKSESIFPPKPEGMGIQNAKLI